MKKAINISEFKSYAVVKSQRGDVELTAKGATVYGQLKAFYESHKTGDTLGLGKLLELYADKVKKNLVATKFVSVKDVQNACDVINGELATDKFIQIYGDLTCNRSVKSAYIRLTTADTLEFVAEKKEAEKSASVATPEEQATALAKQAGEITGLTVSEYLHAVLTACREKYGDEAYKKAFGDLISEYEEKKNKK